MTQTPAGQDPRIAAQNSAFFAENAEYAERIASLTTYRNIRRAIDGAITGTGRLLDVGNGGVFDYDVQLAEEIVGVDLFLDEAAGAGLPEHVSLREGDALDLPEPDASYDAVLLAFVFHHLTGATADDLIVNVRKALAEARRVLRPGGRLIVAESCIPTWFYGIERALFKPLVLASRTKLVNDRVLNDHPATLQLPVEVLRDLVAAEFGGSPAVTRIPVGRWILQFGHKWPTRLTPARPWLLVATAPA